MSSLAAPYLTCVLNVMLWQRRSHRFTVRCGGQRDHAQSQPPRGVCLRYATKCDVYLGLFGHRYGWVIKSENVSVTEFEFDYARQSGKPMLIYLKDGLVADERQKEFWNKVQDFDEGFFLRSFARPDDLPELVREGIPHLFEYYVENSDEGERETVRFLWALAKIDDDRARIGRAIRWYTQLSQHSMANVIEQDDALRELQEIHYRYRDLDIAIDQARKRRFLCGSMPHEALGGSHVEFDRPDINEIEERLAYFLLERARRDLTLRPSQAREDYREAAQLYYRVGAENALRLVQEELADTFYQQAQAHEREQQFDLAREVYTQSLEIYRAIGDWSSQGQVHERLASIFEQNDERYRALEELKESVRCYAEVREASTPTLQVAKKMVELYRQTDHPARNAQAFYAICQNCRSSSGIERGTLEELYRICVRYSERCNNESILAAVLYDLGEMLIEDANDPEVSEENWRRVMAQAGEVLARAEGLYQHLEEQQRIVEVAALFHELGELSRDKAETLIKSLHDEKLEVNERRGNQNEAIGHLETAQELYRRAGNEEKLIEIERLLQETRSTVISVTRVWPAFVRAEEARARAEQYLAEGDMTAAGEAYQQALTFYLALTEKQIKELPIQALEGWKRDILEIADQLNTVDELAYANWRIGLAHQVSDLWPDSVRHLGRSVVLYDRLGNGNAAVRILCEIANANVRWAKSYSDQNLARGRFIAAEVACQRALSIAEAHELGEARATVYVTLGDVLAAQKKWGKAQEKYEEAVPLCESLKAKEALADVYRKLGSILESEDIRSAHDYFRKARQLAGM